MNTQSLKDAVSDGLDELEDLRRVSDPYVSAEKRVAMGQTRAKEYLRGFVRGGPRALLALGALMLGAVFAALGPEHFDLTSHGRSLLSALDDERLEGITPAGLCDGFVTVGESVRAIMTLNGMDQKFLTEAMVVAMMLVKQDQARRHFKKE